MRKRLYDFLYSESDDNSLGRLYEGFMLVMIFISMIPLMIKDQTEVTYLIDKVCVVVFIIDYVMRFITADYIITDKSLPFIRYPFTFMAVVDLLSILPSITHLNQALKALRLLRVLRVLKTLKVSRTFRLFRYSKNIKITVNVIKNTKESLLSVSTFAVAYIFISAIIVFNIEPDTFTNFFEALYWATVSLTTVGYGDIYPTTVAGRTISMISSLFGIAIVALPAGIITAGYMDEIEKAKHPKDEGNKE